jgi:glutathione S-transferase
MKLMGSHASPFVRKARIVLVEKGIDYEFVVDNPNDADSPASDFNPLGKVPVLVTNDGATISGTLRSPSAHIRRTAVHKQGLSK